MSDHKYRPITKIAREIPSYTLREALELPPPTWLVDGMLPDGGLSALIGPPGVGKTFCAVDLAMSVAVGIPWMGQPTKQGRVVYVAAEGHRSVARRMLAWCAYHGIENLTDDVIIIPDAINILGAETSADQFYEAVLEKFPLHTRTFYDDDGEEQHEPVEEAPIRLVILDTLARCMVGGDENSAEDMGAAIAFCDYLRQSSNLTGTADTHVMVIHHTNKSETVERGSTALRGACDTMLHIRRARKEELYNIETVKQRDAEEAAPIALVMQPVPAYESAVLTSQQIAFRGFDNVRQFTGILEGKLSKRQIDVLIAHLLHHAEHHKQGISAPQIGKWIGMAPPNVTYYRGALRDFGYLRALENGRTLITAEGVKFLVDNELLPPVEGDAARVVEAAMSQFKEPVAALGDGIEL